MIQIEPAHIHGEGRLGQPLHHEYLLFPFVAPSLRALNIRHANQAYPNPTYFPKRVRQEEKVAKEQNLMGCASEDLEGSHLFLPQTEASWIHPGHSWPRNLLILRYQNRQILALRKHHPFPIVWRQTYEFQRSRR